jgi:hypothetical protein
VCGIANRAAFTDRADALADRIGCLREDEREDDRHHDGDREGAGKIAEKHQRPVPQYAANRHARTLVEEGQGAEREDARQEIEAEQVEQAEADGKQHRSRQRLSGLHRDGDGEGRGQRQDRARHIGTDQRVARRHEHLRFARIDHLGDEFRRREIGHAAFLGYSVAQGYWKRQTPVVRQAAACCSQSIAAGIGPPLLAEPGWIADAALFMSRECSCFAQNGCTD